jgi:HlyD family secretion protein
MMQAGNDFFLNTSSTAPTQRRVRSQSRVGDRLRTARLRIILALASIIPVLVSALACSKEKQAEPTVAVHVVAVKKATIEQTVTSEAILFPLAQSAIVPKISAPVKAFYVNRGSKVHEGQLLAKLESHDLAAAAEDNQGGYDQAQAAYAIATASTLPEEIQKAQGDTKAAKLALEAEQKLYDSRQDLYNQGALPRKDLDQATVSLAQARSLYEIAQHHLDALMAGGKEQGIKSAKGQLQSAKGKYLGAAAQLSYSEIRSPINGVVTDRSLYAGEMAAAGTPLLTVMDTTSVVARAHIPQEQAALLKVGDKAMVVVAGLVSGVSDKAPGEDDAIEGKVTVVSPALDPNSTTVEVWVQAKNPKGRLRPGTSVRISMLARSVENAVVIPAAAVLTAPDGTSYVMVAGSDNKAHQKTVKIGIRQADQIQILEGLAEGDRVVASGAYGLPDNTKIRVEAAPESDKTDHAPDGASPGKETEKDAQ